MFRYLPLLLVLLLLGTSSAEAQRTVARTGIRPAPELTVMGGYMLSGGTDAYRGVTYGRFDVTSGPLISAAIAVPARPGTNVELTYTYNWSGFIWQPNFGIPDPEENMGVHYIQIGGQQYIPNGNVHPYGSFTVGAAVFSPEGGGSQWEFAFTAGLGVKNYINEKVAVRVDARLVLPVFWGGFGFACGTGGCGSSFGGTVGMWQGAFSGGIVYRLGQ